MLCDYIIILYTDLICPHTTVQLFMNIIVLSGSRERIPLLTRRIVKLDDRLLSSQREKIEECERALNQLQEEHASKEELMEEEWQDIKKELKKQQDQLRLLLQNYQHQQLSETLDLSEKQPNDVRKAYVAFEKEKVAAAETQASVSRHKQLTNYKEQARDLAGHLLNYEDLLNDHMVALKVRKEALVDLESCGEKYIKELTECDQQLEQLQKKLQKNQIQLKSCKEKLQECIKQLEECLDEMDKCEGTLQQSQSELRRCLARLEELRKKQKDDLSRLEQEFQRKENLTDILKRIGGTSRAHLVRNYDDLLEEKKAELQKCSKELEATVRTLEICEKILQKGEMDLGKLKECVKHPQPTVTVAASRTQPDQVCFQASFDCVI